MGILFPRIISVSSTIVQRYVCLSELTNVWRLQLRLLVTFYKGCCSPVTLICYDNLRLSSSHLTDAKPVYKLNSK